MEIVEEYEVCQVSRGRFGEWKKIDEFGRIEGSGEGRASDLGTMEEVPFPPVLQLEANLFRVYFWCC
jgi:hypothetical protein